MKMKRLIATAKSVQKDNATASSTQFLAESTCCACRPEEVPVVIAKST